MLYKSLRNASSGPVSFDLTDRIILLRIAVVLDLVVIVSSSVIAPDQRISKISCGSTFGIPGTAPMADQRSGIRQSSRSGGLRYRLSHSTGSSAFPEKQKGPRLAPGPLDGGAVPGNPPRPLRALHPLTRSLRSRPLP